MENPKTAKGILSLATLITMAAISSWIFFSQKPPKALPSDAVENEFSAERAMQYLDSIAYKPHAIGTPGNEEVRDYILRELKRMGHTPELHLTRVYFRNHYLAATVGNIIVHIPGQNSTKTVCLMGHYDSVEDSFGASDNGAAVVSMLETLRMLKDELPLKNDLLFVFTDGEEVGLIGARAFLRQHPLAKDIGILLNFEASGTSGQSLMFETGDNNRWIIGEFAKASPYPVANSMMFDIYRLMPNDTDFSPFRRAGYQGLNFAYLGNRFDYHTRGDNIENTSPASIQHHGSYALSLTRHFGNINLEVEPRGNAVYFNFVGNKLIHYPYAWRWVIAVFASLFFFLCLLTGIQKHIIRRLFLLKGFITSLFYIAVAPILSLLLFSYIKTFFPGVDFRLLYYRNEMILIGFVLISFVLSLVFYRRAVKGIRWWQTGLLSLLLIILLILDKKTGWGTISLSVLLPLFLWLLHRKPPTIWEHTTGTLVLWFLLMVGTLIFLPGFSYLTSWPFLLLSLGLFFFFARYQSGKTGWSTAGGFLLISIPALVFFIPMIHLVTLAMGLDLISISIAVSCLLFTLMLPVIHIINGPWHKGQSALIATGGIIILILAVTGSSYTGRYRKQNSAILVSDHSTNETYWISEHHADDEWVQQFLGTAPQRKNLAGILPFMPDHTRPAHVIDTALLPPPEIKILSDSIHNGTLREVKLQIRSGRQAGIMEFFFRPKKTPVQLAVDTSEFKESFPYAGTEWRLLRYFALPDSGIQLRIKSEDLKGLEIILKDTETGLPDSLVHSPRPDWMMSQGDRTVSASAFLLDSLRRNTGKTL